ncbi:DUF947-domain-containing protein [Hypoxylon sp. NC1633]|nr:DUF947-domain-containing protein [Hypoxylon sp. NC1633]
MDRTASSKRKAPLPTLQRRVRARRDEPEEIFSDASQVEGSSEEEHPEKQSEDEADQDDDESSSSSHNDEDDDDDDDDDEEGVEHTPAAAVSQISFGALAKAQASLTSLRRRGRGEQEEHDENEDADEDDNPSYNRKDASRDSKAKAPKPHRSSKHAPAEQTSKRPVSRKREVVVVHKPVARDPRFSAATSGRPGDEDRARRAYAFLDEYRDSEMSQLRAAAKKTRDPNSKEELKRALASMESRKRAQKLRNKERELVEEHRRREKELVKQGKKPFYLKKSEQKKRLLVDQFSALKNKQADRVIERRRKKLAAKERRDMPMTRRDAN